MKRKLFFFRRFHQFGFDEIRIVAFKKSQAFFELEILKLNQIIWEYTGCITISDNNEYNFELEVFEDDYE